VALLLAPILRVEVGFAEAFLQLNLVARHRRFLPKNKMFYVCSHRKSKLTQERNQEDFSSRWKSR
jgi:hypothetical protein